MLRLTTIVPERDPRPASGAVTLGFTDRRRSRLRARLDDGRVAALVLPRGTVLRDGDRLCTDDGAVVVEVRAQPEVLSFARTSDPLLLARAAYHLGNRHVPVQIAPGAVAYEHDHVLDRMIADIGLALEAQMAPFEPEAGGYRHGGGHAHDELAAPAPAAGDDHDRGHGHDH